MTSVKYIGLDVHQATIAAAVLDGNGKLVMESVVETRGSTIVEFLRGLRGELVVTFEEGASAAWLHDLLKPHVSKLMVCDPRKNALLKSGSKSDRIDARKLAELLRGGQLSGVYHGEAGIRTLKELARSYLTLTQDATRVMNRIKAVYRSQAIPCRGRSVYAVRDRSEWLKKLVEPGMRRRAESLHQQLDLLEPLRQQARREFLAESRKYPARRRLQQIPCIGALRAALLIAFIQTPHRFRTKRLVLAFTVAAISDVLAVWVVFLPPLQWALDLVTAFLLFLILGRQWMILPGLIAEAIPGIAVFPFWILVVASIAVWGKISKQPS